MKFYHLFMVQLIKFRCLNYCDCAQHRSSHARKKTNMLRYSLVQRVFNKLPTCYQTQIRTYSNNGKYAIEEMFHILS